MKRTIPSATGEWRKVLLIRNVAPENYGGGEKYSLVLAGELKRHGFDPVVVSASRKLLSEARRGGFGAVVAPYNQRQNWSGWRNLLLPAYFLWLRKLSRFYRGIFEKYRPAAINVQSRDDWIAATRAAKEYNHTHADQVVRGNTAETHSGDHAKRITILWTDHMDFRDWVFVNMDKPYKNLIGKMILASSRDADEVVMISDYEKNAVKKMLMPHKMRMAVIKNGAVDKAKEYRSVKPRAKSFVYVGRIVEYKGVFELIRAFSEVLETHPDATLHFYGEGEGLEECREMAGGNPAIVFHGYTEDPLKAIAENYCFVLPSHKEGLSLSLLDAAMMGRPIITTNVGGNPEVVKDHETGLLVPAKNMKKLTAAMCEILEGSKLARVLAKNVRAKYEKEFDFSKTFAEKMLPLYNKKKEE